MGWLRTHLGMDAPRAAASGRDRLAFGGWMGVVVAVQLLLAIVLIGAGMALHRAFA